MLRNKSWPPSLQTNYRPPTPFSFACLDMMGPFHCKDIANSRRSIKVWPHLYSCLSTHTVCILGCPGHSTSAFMETYKKFCAIYKPPIRIHTDHGSQLVAGTTGPDWEEVQLQASIQGTDWVLMPVQCVWRNAQAESHIRSSKNTLKHLIPRYASLDFNQLDSALHQVAFILNERPLAIRTSQEDTYCSITLNDVLLGRAAQSPSTYEDFSYDEEADTAISRNLSAQEALVAEWWQE